MYCTVIVFFSQRSRTWMNIFFLCVFYGLHIHFMANNIYVCRFLGVYLLILFIYLLTLCILKNNCFLSQYLFVLVFISTSPLSFLCDTLILFTQEGENIIWEDSPRFNVWCVPNMFYTLYKICIHYILFKIILITFPSVIITLTFPQFSNACNNICNLYWLLLTRLLSKLMWSLKNSFSHSVSLTFVHHEIFIFMRRC